VQPAFPSLNLGLELLFIVVDSNGIQKVQKIRSAVLNRGSATVTNMLRRRSQVHRAQLMAVLRIILLPLTLFIRDF